MKKIIMVMTAAATLAGMSAPAVQADPFGKFLADVVGFAEGGHNYCWYDNGWQGPGWYWCGYRDRRGYGWGGGEGWHGHHHNQGGRRDYGDHRDRDRDNGGYRDDGGHHDDR